MTQIKKTLLQIIQDILSDTDGEPINSISDTLEGEQAAAIVEHVFYDLVTTRSIPEHLELIKLTPFSDSRYPTHWKIPDNVTDIDTIWYDTSEDESLEYSKIDWCEPKDFLRMSDGRQSDFTSVVDPVSGTTFRITNNNHPRYYTSFDDENIIMDAYKSTLDDTLHASKIRALGRKLPVFDRFDDAYIPDLDYAHTQYLIAESRARFMDWFKGGVPQKAEQASRRVKSYMQNDKHRIKRGNKRNGYGR